MLRHALHRAAPRHALHRAAPAAAAAARRTYLAQPKQRWHLVDAAQGVSVGRLAAAIAPVLRGKHKPGFEPHRHEHGDFVVVVNADQLVFTGKKWQQKLREPARRGEAFRLRVVQFRARSAKLRPSTVAQRPRL